ncbi:hypothetical protein SLS62_009005 [Diatrype stigma]|uniref:Isochorismatase-like domain-containing protein n=1 Tax=Diatrype stigma TaxID=117547 RepID=A0AAN9UG07_9PEZI
MFPIDPAKLPALKTRRGLLIVDPQNDFLAKDGALAVKNPGDLPRRMADLVTAFRQNGGEIIWVHSRFEKPRPAQNEQIVTSDGPLLTGASAAGKGRRPRAPPQEIEASKCPEAFLGPEAATRPKCVRTGSSGIEMHPTVREAIHPKDHTFVKSYYSAFKSDQLLRHLRMRLVTELFICGSLTNIGVMASAVDAASHGYSIAIVEDCCGYRSSMRHNNALQQISDSFGCDILTAEETLEILQPKSRSSQRSSQRPSRAESRNSSVRRRTEEEDATASLTSKLESSFGKLSLNSEPAADGPQRKARAESSKQSLQPVVGSSKEKGDEEKNTKREKEKETSQDPSDDPVPQPDGVGPSASQSQQSASDDESESDDVSAAENSEAEVEADAEGAAQKSAKRSGQDSDEKKVTAGPSITTKKLGSQSAKEEKDSE